MSAVARRLALTLCACLAVLCLGAASALAASIEGEVSAEEGGAAIADVLVCAYPVGAEFAESCDSTDALGEYAIEGLAAAEYKVEFWAGWAGLPFFGEFWEDRESFANADPIELGADEVRAEVDAELESAGSIAGTVTAADGGAPLEEAEVCAYGEDGFRCGWTGEDGGYALGELPADTYEVEFFSYENYSPQYHEDRDHSYEADDVEVELGEVASEIDAAMKSGGQISGRVTAAATGAPLPEIVVCSIEAAATELFSCAQTNAAGQYTLRRLVTDVYKVGFSIDLGEWLGEGSEVDGYDAQFYSGQTNLVSANPVAVIAPNSVGGIDASLRRTGETRALPPLPPATVLPVVPKGKPKPKPRRCRPGFKKKKVKGKVRCVKVHKKRRNAKGKAGARDSAFPGSVRIRLQP